MNKNSSSLRALFWTTGIALAFVSSAADVAIGTDIIQNGGFESNTSISGNNQTFANGASTDFWTGSAMLENASSAVLGVSGYVNGTYALAFHGDGYVQQTVTVPVDGYYQFSMRSTRRNNTNKTCHFYLLVAVDDVDQGIYHKTCASTETTVETLPCIKLTAGQHIVKISGERGNHTLDATLHIDDVALKLFSTDGVGAECVVNGGFENNSVVSGGKQDMLDNEGTGTEGWTGTAKLATKTTQFSGFYSQNGSNSDLLGYNYGIIMQMNATLVGTVNVITGGEYRLSYRWRRREASAQTLGITIGNRVIRSPSAISGTTPQVECYENIDLDPGTYSIVFTTAVSGNTDASLFIDDVSLVCTEVYTDVIYVTKPVLASDTAIYDGKNKRPAFQETEDYTVSYSPDGVWKEIGDSYTITFTLKGNGERKWRGGGQAQLVYHFSISRNALKNGGFENGSMIASGNFGNNDGITASTYYWTGGKLEKAGSSHLSNNDVLGDSTYAMALQANDSISETIDIQSTGYYQLSLKYNRRNYNLATPHYLVPYIDNENLYILCRAAQDATNVTECTFPPFKLTEGSHEFKLAAERVNSNADVTINVDDLTLTMISRGEDIPVGCEALFNGGFEINSFIASGNVALLSETDNARTDGWSGTGGARLANPNAAHGVSAIINYRHCVIMQQNATLTGTINAPVKGKYRLSFRWQRRPNYSGNQTLGITIGDKVIREPSLISGEEVSTAVYEDISLRQGTYPITFTTAVPSGDPSLFIDDVSLVCTEPMNSRKLIITFR